MANAEWMRAEANTKYFAVPPAQLQHNHCVTCGIANQDSPFL